MHTHESDDVLLGMFRQLGLDFSKPREINFYFAFATESDAEHASRELAQRKFKSERIKIDPPWWKRLFAKPQWSVSVSQEMSLDESKIKSITTIFQQIATTCNGQYDGWEANVMEDQLDVGQIENLGD